MVQRMPDLLLRARTLLNPLIDEGLVRDVRLTNVKGSPPGVTILTAGQADRNALGFSPVKYDEVTRRANEALEGLYYPIEVCA
jgi:hypothetical protein